MSRLRVAQAGHRESGYGMGLTARNNGKKARSTPDVRVGQWPQIPPSALMKAFPGCGFGDNQEDVTVADDHNGRQEMWHDFNGIVSISLT